VNVSLSLEASFKHAVAVGARAFADAFDSQALSGGPDVVNPGSAVGPTGSTIVFDPRHDDLPHPADPKGTEDERVMTYLTYLGAVMLINDTENRGLTADEVSKYAKKAGYANGRGVNGFGINEASTKTIAGKRWISDRGRAWLVDLQQQLHLSLPQVGQ
jgi:hypothetical protein